jgi:hypothetical protein
MTKIINVDGMDYKVSDRESIKIDDELIFEIKNDDDVESKFVIAMFDDMLGLPIKKVWKIID